MKLLLKASLCSLHMLDVKFCIICIYWNKFPLEWDIFGLIQPCVCVCATNSVETVESTRKEKILQTCLNKDRLDKKKKKETIYISMSGASTHITTERCKQM